MRPDINTDNQDADIQPRQSSSRLHSAYMFQLGLSLLRPVVPAARSAVRPTIVSVNIRPAVISGRISTRSFSSLRKPSSILNELKKNPTNGWSLKQGARFFQSGGEGVRLGAAGISWQRMAATAVSNLLQWNSLY